jgi:serine protease Do
MNRHLASKFKIGFHRGSQARFLGVACSLLLIPATLHTATGQQSPSTSQETNSLSSKVADSVRSLSKENSPAIVRIRCHDENGEIVGTGFYLDPTGTIITLAEIVLGAKEITVEQSDGSGEIKKLSATLTAIDLRSGVAFLKAPADNNSTAFFSPIAVTNPPEFAPVIGMGYPRERTVTPVLGMITGSKNHEGSVLFCVPHLTASLPLSPGEGGAPVFDLSGNLLGIVITGNTQQGSCSILPSAAIAQLHHNLLRYGAINPGWVGAVVELAAVPQNNSRTRIVSVAPGSPAETAGILPGDILLSLGTHSIQNPEDVLEASFYLTAGEKLQATVLRKGIPQNLTLECAEQPAPYEGLDASASSTPPPLLGGSAH